MSSPRAEAYTHVILEDHLIETFNLVDIADINFKYKQLPQTKKIVSTVCAFLSTDNCVIVHGQKLGEAYGHIQP